jgi:hypothetical protein
VGTEWWRCWGNGCYTSISLFRLNRTSSILASSRSLSLFRALRNDVSYYKCTGRSYSLRSVSYCSSSYRETKICTIEGKQFLFGCYSVCAVRSHFMRGCVPEDLAQFKTNFETHTSFSLTFGGDYALFQTLRTKWNFVNIFYIALFQIRIKCHGSVCLCLCVCLWGGLQFHQAADCRICTVECWRDRLIWSNQSGLNRCAIPVFSSRD